MASKSRKTKRPAGASAKTAPKKRARVTADEMASRQREISVSEFFSKNRHLLGFDNPRKALLTTVKEAVDNALDACEEAGHLPDIRVTIENLTNVSETRFRVTIEDNGPGIVRKQIDNIFGKLLYGSKFHRLRMSRGQQGIGISAAGMYGLMTTGKPMVIVTRPSRRKPAHHVELAMDTTKNRPEVTIDVETDDFPDHTGTRVAIELEGRYSRGRTSVDEYIEQTAIANPHAQFTYRAPTRTTDEQEADAPLLADETAAEELKSLTRTTKLGDVVVFPRTVHELPPEPKEIKPHPMGVELGSLMQMLKQTEHTSLGVFLQKSFCRVSPRVANALVDKAGLTMRSRVSQINHAKAEAIHKAMQSTRFTAPPMDCLAPIGAQQILAGLLKGVLAEFYTACVRPPAVYRGNPFQIEVGLAFGGALPGDQLARVIRFANRAPLLYQQSACALHKAVVETTWRNYGLSQSRGAAPEAPLVVMIHMASVWAPFTSESKEAIADYDEIRKEMRLALQECGRKLAAYVRKRQRIRREGQRRDVFERYIGEVVRAMRVIDPDVDPARVRADLEEVARCATALADENTGAEDASEEHAALARDENTVLLDGHADPTPTGAAKSESRSRTRRGPRGRARTAKARTRAPAPEESLF